MLIAFWSRSAQESLEALQSSLSGITHKQAQQRLGNLKQNSLQLSGKKSDWSLLLLQFNNPIIFILIAASVLSVFLGDKSDTFIILTIVFFSGMLGFWQERGANKAVLKLLALIHITAAVMRDGEMKEISVDQVVPGDIVMLKAGDNIPGDCLLLESKDFTAIP